MSIIKTNATITSIEFSPSGDVAFIRCKPADSFSFQEGQFIMITIDSLIDEKGKPMRKVYSIATTQQELTEIGTIGCIIKNTHPGGMSEYLTQRVKIGDTLVIDGPYGHMMDKPGYTNYLLIAAGSGLSPILGLYESIIAKQGISKVALLYGERYMNAMLPSIAEIFSKNYNNGSLNKDKTLIKSSLLLSKETLPTDNQNTFRKSGHVQDGLEDVLQFLGEDKNKTLVFICGMPEMVDDIKVKLDEYGVKKENILVEKY